MKYTYEELEAELYNKGNGNRMLSRNVGSNTKLERLPTGNVGIRYFRTMIIEWTPDGRVILRMNGWNTPSTRLRFRQYLSHPLGIQSINNRPYASARLRLPDVNKKIETWTTILVPFVDGMSFDLATGELLGNPDATPISLADDFGRVINRSKGLRPIVNELVHKRLNATTGHADIDYALRLYERWRKQREIVAEEIRTLDSHLTWEQALFEEEMERTMGEYSARQYPRQEAQKEVKGQIRVQTLVPPFVPDN